MKTTQDFNIWFDIDGMNIVPPVCRRAFASLNTVTAWTFAQALYAYVKTGRICLRRCRYGHSTLAIFDLAIAYIDLLRRQTADSPSGEAVSTTISDTAEVAPDAVATGVDRITDRNSDKDSDTPREEEKITETKVSPTPPSKIKTTEREEEKPEEKKRSRP